LTVSNFWIMVSGLGLRVLSSGFRIQLKVSGEGLGFQISDQGRNVKSCKLRARGWVFGLRVQGLQFRF